MKAFISFVSLLITIVTFSLVIDKF